MHRSINSSSQVCHKERTLGRGALGEELDGRVTPNLVPGSNILVHGIVGVIIGNDAFRIALEGLGEFLESRFERFAVSAPRGRECYQYVVFGVLVSW